jgi:uncharacterized membrane protein YkvA (DUF1232 family)
LLSKESRTRLTVDVIPMFNIVDDIVVVVLVIDVLGKAWDVEIKGRCRADDLMIHGVETFSKRERVTRK